MYDVHHRVLSRFFDQVGHETMYASSGNKPFFTKSCHRLTYQNYEQPPRTSQNSVFQSHFSVLKIGRIVPIFFSLKALFIILVGLTVTLFSEKRLISTRCIHGFMPNSIKKSVTVSIFHIIT